MVWLPVDSRVYNRFNWDEVGILSSRFFHSFIFAACFIDSGVHGFVIHVKIHIPFIK